MIYYRVSWCLSHNSSVYERLRQAGPESFLPEEHAVENAWSNPIEHEEHSHAAMANAYAAGAAGMAGVYSKGFGGSDLVDHNDKIRFGSRVRTRFMKWIEENVTPRG